MGVECTRLPSKKMNRIPKILARCSEKKIKMKLKPKNPKKYCTLLTSTNVRRVSKNSRCESQNTPSNLHQYWGQGTHGWRTPAPPARTPITAADPGTPPDWCSLGLPESHNESVIVETERFLAKSYFSNPPYMSKNWTMQIKWPNQFQKNYVNSAPHRSLA